jgi:hypothetical protein
MTPMVGAIQKKEAIRATPTLGALRKVPMKGFCRCKPYKKD